MTRKNDELEREAMVDRGQTKLEKRNPKPKESPPIAIKGDARPTVRG